MRKIRGRFCERKVLPKGAFDRRSFRWKKNGRAWVLVGCPKRHWKRGRCAVGMKARVVLVKSKKSCRIGEHAKTKGR